MYSAFFRILPSIIVIVVAIIYAFILPATARKYVVAFSFVSVAVAAILVWIAFALPKPDILLVVIFMAYCLAAAAFQSFLRSQGLGITLILPSWLTFALIALGVLIILANLVMVGLVWRFS